MKVLILCIYYNRPILLRKAMNSVLEANKHHTNWEMVFGDDNSPIPGEPIVRDILSDFTDKIKFINSKMSFEDKIEKGLSVGKYANEVLKESDADIAITLCDDDELVPTYLKDICSFFEQNPKEKWAYSHLAIFNPLHESSKDIDLIKLRSCPYNFSVGRINPTGKLDSSQVAFRIDSLGDSVKYPETSKFNETMPWLINPDAFLFEAMYKKYGEIPFSGLVSQYKGVHDYQLVWNKKQGAGGLKEYVDKVNKVGGKIL